MAWTDGIVIKTVNIVLFLSLLGSNIYSVAGPEDAYTSSRETYVTPSYYANYVWSLTHLLLLGTMIYQFTETGKKVIVDGLQWRFAVLILINQVYVWTWAKHWYITSFIFSLLVSAAVTAIYYIVKAQHKGETISEELFVHLPFSLYHGWAIVLVVLSGFEAFGVEAHKHHAGIWTKIFVFLAFLFLESTAVGYAFSTAEGDAAGAAVISFALFAIFLHQTDKFVRWSAFAFFILSLFAIIKSIYTTARGSGSVLDDEERAPLVGSE